MKSGTNQAGLGWAGLGCATVVDDSMKFGTNQAGLGWAGLGWANYQ